MNVRAPEYEGDHRLVWDMVQDGGIGWFSSGAVPAKTEIVSIWDGVRIYGKGWGHGIGLSQWGAQGWAQGAAGVRLTGEQIVAKYFPGAQLSKQPITQPFRVLLSAPSTGCVEQHDRECRADGVRGWHASGEQRGSDGRVRRDRAERTASFLE